MSKPPTLPDIPEPGEPRVAGERTPFLKILEHNTYRLQLTADPRVQSTQHGERLYVTGLLLGTTDKDVTVSQDQQKRPAKINEAVTLSVSQKVLRARFDEVKPVKGDVVDVLFKGLVEGKRYYDFEVRKYVAGQAMRLER